MNPAVIIGGGLLLLALAAGKKKGGGGGQKPLPEPDDGADSGEPAPTPENQKVLAVLDDYVMPDGYEFPDDITTEEWPETLWLSDDCKAYAVGSDFVATLTPDITEFYHAVVDTVIQDDPELASAPPDHWEQVMFDAGYENPFESPTKRWAIQYLFDTDDGIHAVCADKLPVLQDFESWDEYLAAFAALKEEEPALYRLFYRHLYQPAIEVMETEWEERFPEQAQLWIEREWAAQAMEQNLNLEDRTDWAFHHAYPEGPEVLDPENPEHQDYVQAWLRLNEMIKEMM
jgi:hypothetical protein